MSLITITQISTQPKNKNLYFLHLEYENKKKLLVSVNEETVINYNIKKGQQILEQQLNDIIYADQINTAMQIALKFLAHRPRSINEIKNQLVKKQTGQGIIEIAIDRLCKLNYLNDYEYAQNYIANQININNVGPLIIEHTLKDHKIDEEIYTSYLKNYNYDKQLCHATILADKFLKKQKTSRMKAKQKTIDYLLRKGHTIDVARAVCEENLSSYVTREKEWSALCKDGFLLHEKYKQHDNNTYCRLLKNALIRRGYPFELINNFLNAGKEAIENQEIDFPFY